MAQIMEPATQTKGLKRNVIDKFYTSSSTVEFCMKEIQKTGIIKEGDLIIEPSAGNGSFINSIKQLSSNYKFYDLVPENDEIIKQDYLLLNISDISKFSDISNNVHIIGNPPFGRQSSMAIQFIKKSLFASSISFILPKSFKKVSLQNRFPLCFHLIYEKDIPKNAFLVNDKEYDVECVFQIWVKKDYNRKKEEKLICNDFVFVKKGEADISVRRVGVNAGFVDVNCEKSVQSHYFIKFAGANNIKQEIIKQENIKKMYNLSFEFNNTVGPRSISKQELILAYSSLSLDKK